MGNKFSHSKGSPDRPDFDYYVTDIPEFIDVTLYQKILNDVVRTLSGLKGVEAVYQIGGISTPGVSDLDLVVVFTNDFQSDFDLHKHLSAIQKYLFIHRLYGCPVSFFQESSLYSFFHNFSLLAGEEIIRKSVTDNQSENLIRIQTAMEYMLKLYVNIILQKEYGILQARSLLLHGKALLFDLSHLSLSDPLMNQLMQDLMEIRNGWFRLDQRKKRLSSWFNRFVDIYPAFLNECMNKYGFYLENQGRLSVSGNIILQKADTLSYRREGMSFPSFPVLLLGKRYYRLQNRFNKFTFQTPFRDDNIPEALSPYFDFRARHRAYNAKYLPKFMTLTSSLLS